MPEFDQGRASKVLPLHGVVSPRTENTIETGVGYSTDVGPRVKATWKKPWVNDRGHSFSTSANLSAPEQQLDFSYKIPLLKSPLEQYYLLQGGLKGPISTTPKRTPPPWPHRVTGTAPAAGSVRSICAGAWITLRKATSPTLPC